MNTCFGGSLPKSTCLPLNALSKIFGKIIFVLVNKHFKGVEGYNGGVKEISKETLCSLERKVENHNRVILG